MTDLTPTLIAKSDILNADDLIGKPPMTIKVTRVNSVSGEQPIAVYFEGDNGKPFMPCKSMRRVMAQVWGPDGKLYAGRSMTLYRDPTVKFGALEVGGIRISHMSNIDSEVTLALTAMKGQKKAYKVKPLKIAAPAPEIDPKVKAAGDDAASRGVEEYTKWKDSLAPEIKETIRPYHGGWTASAKNADETEGAE